MKKEDIKKIVKEAYSGISKNSCCSSCCCSSPETTSKNVGYSEEEMNAVPEANLGFGCGNPTALANIREGDVVLDLGSGAGFDAFLAADKCGKTGKVIGVDMTEEMLEKAVNTAERYGYNNVEFKLGDIEDLPLNDNSIDVILSNCVINLAPDKDTVFSEAFRVLKENGKLFVSDIVLLEELTEEQKNDETLIAGCVGGALQKQDYIDKLERVGFEVKVLGEDKEISTTQYGSLPVESLTIEARIS